MKTNWIPFWFESNQYFDWVNSPDDWQKVKDIYPDLDLGKRALRCDSSKKHKYGLCMEYTGEPLKDFFTRNNMEI